VGIVVRNREMGGKRSIILGASDEDRSPFAAIEESGVGCSSTVLSDRGEATPLKPR